jgi:hypothetical protein
MRRSLRSQINCMGLAACRVLKAVQGSLWAVEQLQVGQSQGLQFSLDA